MNETNSQNDRKKRHSAMDTFLNFGICLGDIAPEIREKHPGKRVYIVVRTSQAPSIQFQAANGGKFANIFQNLTKKHFSHFYFMYF